jgi:hypothetical protein
VHLQPSAQEGSRVVAAMLVLQVLIAQA